MTKNEGLTSIGKIDFRVYETCFIDYVSGKMPFLFVNYGILYPDLLNFAKSSVDFIDFIFSFIVSGQKQQIIDKSIDFLLESGLSLDEIKEHIAEKIMEVSNYGYNKE